MIAAVCKGCGKRYKLDEKYAGKKIRCKECQEVVAVPAAAAAKSASRELDGFDDPPAKPLVKKKPVPVTPPPEDDFLNDLNEFAEKEEPPNELADLPKRKPVSKKKSESSTSSGSGFSLPRGGIFMMLLGGLLGGAIGAVIWGAVAYFTDHEIGWIAWGIGWLVGLGFRVLADEEYDGTAPGFLAPVVAIISIFAGKSLGTFLMVIHLIQKGQAPPGLPQDTFTLTMVSIIGACITFHPLDLLFFGLAIFTSHKVALHGTTNAE